MMHGACRDGSENRCAGAAGIAQSELLRDANCWPV